MTLTDLQRAFVSLTRISPEDFWILLAHITQRPKTFLLAHPEYTLSVAEVTQAHHLLSRRLIHEPVAYLVGSKEFFGLPFAVTRDTLIPRPETEQLVELVLSDLAGMRTVSPEHTVTLADIGTGSGAILLALAATLNNTLGLSTTRSLYSLHATDISHTALDVARHNASKLQLDTLVSFHEGNLLEPLLPCLATTHHIILIANLPYLSPQLYASAPKTVTDFEPKHALLSPNDGLTHYRALFQQLTCLVPTTRDLRVYCEISPEQAPIITREATHTFPRATTHLASDLSGKPRVFVLKLSSS